MADQALRRELPIPPRDPDALVAWAQRLTQWLREGEREIDDFEERFVFGVDKVANKIRGIEGTFSGYIPPYSEEILAAPAAGKKRVLISLMVSSDSTSSRNIKLIKKADGGENDIIHVQLSKTVPFLPLLDIRVVLDDTDESLDLEITDGTEDLHFDAAYIDLD